MIVGKRPAYRNRRGNGKRVRHNPGLEISSKSSIFLNRMRRTTTFSIRGCPPRKATGRKPVIMVTVFDRGCQGIGNLTETATGFGPIAAGTGTQTSLLAGQPITTADGSILLGPDIFLTSEAAQLVF